MINTHHRDLQTTGAAERGIIRSSAGKHTTPATALAETERGGPGGGGGAEVCMLTTERREGRPV
jgi:hypothetical protein